MKFKQSRSVLFLDPLVDKKIEYENKKIDIILSPSLYWVKRVKLPISSLREVKKLLPSIFEDTLPVGNYSYSAYKVDDEFMLFAYEDRKILDLLTLKGIGISQIASIHFAQSEFETLKNAIKINQEEAMYFKDGLLLLTPLSWVKDYSALDLSSLTLSKHTISLQQFGHIVDNKSLYKIAIVGVIFIVILVVEIFITLQKTKAIVDAKDEIFSSYKLPSTMLQNHATQKKYKKIYTRQSKLRSDISAFLSLKVQKEQKITLIEYKNKQLNVTLEKIDEKSKNSILSQLDAKKIKYKTLMKDKKMRVEVKL